MRKVAGYFILFLFLFIITGFENISYAKVSKLEVTSSDFNHKGIIPDVHACDFIGLDKSPQLSFGNAPEGTQSFALIMFDPDAPDKNFVHWVIFNIPGNNPELAQDIPRDSELENATRQGANGTQAIGYFGPCPPPKETHRYVFKVFALDVVLSLQAEADSKQLAKAMKGHIIGRGKIIGLYKNNTDF